MIETFTNAFITALGASCGVIVGIGILSALSMLTALVYVYITE